MRETIKLRRGSFSLPLKADKIKKIKLVLRSTIFENCPAMFLVPCIFILS
jgi:hypothetical protein